MNTNDIVKDKRVYTKENVRTFLYMDCLTIRIQSRNLKKNLKLYS